MASWKHYNEMAAAGEDTDYYKEKHRLMAIDTPPFYGVRTGAWFLATLDGVTIDTNMHPCDENGDPIEGLYLTGNDSGGFFSVSYPNLLTGLAGGNRAGVRRPRLQGPFAFASRLFHIPRRQFVKPFPRDTAGRASPPATSGYKSEPPVPCGQGVFACRMEGGERERKGVTWKRNALQKRRAPRAGSLRCF